jgi:hypothetical protein
MIIKNLTPHKIDIITQNGTITIQPSGIVARMAVNSVKVGLLGDIDIFKTEFGDVQDLPNKELGVVYIVSALVATHVKREDVLSPAELVRDALGNVVGCKGLQVHA